MQPFDEWLETAYIPEPDPKSDEDEPLEEAQCICGKWGEVNYDDGSFRGYFCGGSPRCCP